MDEECDWVEPPPLSVFTVQDQPVYTCCYDHSEAPMTITQLSPTSSTPKAIAHFTREGTTEACGSRATLKLSRFEDVLDHSRSQLDLVLAHDNYNDVDVMNLKSNGDVNVPGSLSVGGTAVALETDVESIDTRLTTVEDAGYITSSGLTGYATETYVDTAVSSLATENYVDTAVSGVSGGGGELTVLGTNASHNTTIYPLKVETVSSSSTAVQEGIGTGIEFRVERRDTDSIQGHCGAIRVYGAGGLPGTSDLWNMAFRVRDNDTQREPMTIKYNGFVGIGTDDPTCKLTVGDLTHSVNSTGGVLGIRQKGDTDIDGITLTSSHGNSTRMYKDANGHFHLNNTGGGTFTLENGTGDVGIGKNSPDAKLHVNGNAIIGDVGGYGVTHTDAQLTLGGTHNTTYNNNDKIKLLITGGNNDGGSPYYIMCEDENGYDQFWVKGGTSGNGTGGKVYIKGHVGINRSPDYGYALDVSGIAKADEILSSGGSYTVGAGNATVVKHGGILAMDQFTWRRVVPQRWTGSIVWTPEANDHSALAMRAVNNSNYGAGSRDWRIQTDYYSSARFIESRYNGGWLEFRKAGTNTSFSNPHYYHVTIYGAII